jgi:hypothetical protein
MDDPRSRADARKDAEIAAADWLMEETPAPESVQSPSPVIAPVSGESFELADTPEPADTAEPVDAPEPAKAPPARPSIASPGAARVRPAEPDRRSRSVLQSGPLVEQVWSRTSEWGPTLVVLFCWGAAMLGILYLTLSWELYELSAMIFIAGCLGAVFLSYPILITLERPVRITPEQAARDYFGALSHHLPHHRRMWLLLSARGRVSPHFASYEGFKNYWNSRINQLRKGHAGPLSPLVFVVEDFRAEKSAGKTEMDARFKVKVFVRGHRSEGPIWSLPVERSFARGPDGMWYLDDGTLAERSASGGPTA